MIFRKALAFLKRDFLINSSYKLSFLFDAGSIFFSVLTFFFIARLFGKNAEGYLGAYGGGYFPFVLVGIAFSGYMGAAMGSFTQVINEERFSGTLEAVLLSPTKISVLLICGSAWNFIFTSFRVVVYLVVGWAFFGFGLDKANIFSACVILVLTIISFSGLGIMSAACLLVLKRGDPINWLFSGLSKFLAGVYFPISILPIWAQKISYLLPLTYSLEAIRKALITGSSIKELIVPVIALGVFCVIFMPLSIFVFKFALRKTIKDGSLTHY